MAEILQISIFENKKKSPQFFKNQEILLFKVKKIFFSNLTVPLWGPPEGIVFRTIFSAKNILRKKTLAIRNSKNQSLNPGTLTPGGVGCGGGCANQKLAKERESVLRVLLLR